MCAAIMPPATRSSEAATCRRMAQGRDMCDDPHPTALRRSRDWWIEQTLREARLPVHSNERTGHPNRTTRCCSRRRPFRSIETRTFLWESSRPPCGPAATPTRPFLRVRQHRETERHCRGHANRPACATDVSSWNFVVRRRSGWDDSLRSLLGQRLGRSVAVLPDG